MLNEIITIAIAYLMGSIPVGLIISKIKKGIDIREYGSGNIGATNVYRSIGKKEGLMTFAGDMLKGVMAVLTAYFVLGEEIWIGISGLSAVIGHMYPIFAKFRGGKGVATGVGVFICMMPLATLSSMAIWIICCAIWRYVSLASMVAALSLPIIGGLYDQPKFYIISSTILAILVVYRHKDNIKRLLDGNEGKIWEKEKRS
jgi:glycerol-3-phosphate acyltransferase PlsY